MNAEQKPRSCFYMGAPAERNVWTNERLKNCVNGVPKPVLDLILHEICFLSPELKKNPWVLKLWN